MSFALIVAAGYLWRFFEPGGLDRLRLRHALSSAVLHVFLPALAFGLIATARVDRSFVAVPLVAGITTLAGLAAGMALYRFLPVFNRSSRPAIGVLLLSSAFGNVTYLGLPVINETLGQEYGYIAILYDLLATTPILLTVGMMTAARFGTGAAVSVRASFRRVLKLPPLWGVAVGVAVQLAAVQVPRPVLDAAQLMGRAVIPVMIFTVGLALDFRDLRRIGIAVPALGLKLIAAPALAWLLGTSLGISGQELRAVVIEGAMPVMVLSLVIADEFDLDVPLAATCIAVSTVASFFTLPVMMKMLF
ncbi:MAG: AEC family transporter [Nitrospirota bacterium]|nr:AEC family transporter [Nitrospirota bacterium]